MFVDGLSRLDKHGFATEPCRSSTMAVFVNELFTQTIAQMPLLLAVNVGNTNAAVSTVVGEGVAKAIMGGDGAAEFVVTWVALRLQVPLEWMALRSTASLKSRKRCRMASRCT